MLQIQNLTITHKKDLRNLIEDFSFVLRPGDKTALIGEEGNGKSTLLKLLHDERLVEGYVSWSGHVIKNGMRSGYLAQEPGEDVTGCRVYEYFAENPLFYDWTPKELAQMGRNFGFSTEFFYSDQKISTLSGGISCCWMNLPTTWIWKRWSGWRRLSAERSFRCCLSPTMNICWSGRRIP